MADVKMSALSNDTSIGGSEKLLALDSTTSKTITTGALAAYAIDCLAAAASATPTTGDDIAGFRSGVEKLFDLNDLADYVNARDWSEAASAASALSGDVLLITRSNVVYALGVDALVTYALSNAQAGILNIAALSAATLGSTDQFLVVQSTTAKKTTLSALETKLWTDMATYVAALSANSAAADGDVFYCIQGGNPKYVLASVFATYVLAEIKDAVVDSAWDAALVDPALSTDVLVCQRSDVQKTVTVDTLTDYVDSVFAATSAVNPLVTGDEMLLYRSGTRKVGTIDNVSDWVLADAWNSTVVTTLSASDYLFLGRAGAPKVITWEYFTAGIRATALDISGFSAASLDATDTFLVCEGSSPKKAALSALETTLWADFLTYVTGLSAVSTAADGDIFYCLQGGAAKYMTGTVLAVYMAAEIGPGIIETAFDADAVASMTTGDLMLLERSAVRKRCTVDMVSDFALAALGASAAVTPVASSDKFILYRSGVAKTADISDIVTYVLAQAWGQTAGGAIVTGDELCIGRSNVSKTITVDALATFVLDGIQADVLDISGLDAATLGGTDNYLVVQGGVAKKTTLADIETKLWSDFATYTAALTDAATVADGDKFYMLVSGAPKYCTGTEIATYISAELWAAAAASSVVGTDTFLIDHSGTTKEATIAQLQTFLLVDLQASVLDIHSLTEATVTAADLLLVCQSGTGKQATVGDVGEVMLTGTAAYIETLDPGTPAGTDNLFLSQGGTAKSLAVSDLVDYVLTTANEYPWTEISATKYTVTPAGTSTVTFSDTTDLAVGRPVRYTYNATVYYGIITAISANASMTIAGAPLDVGSDLTKLEIGLPSQLEVMDLTVAGTYADNTEDILAGTANRYIRWRKSSAYLVAISATHKTADTGANQPKLNVKVGGDLVSTEDSNAGLQLSTAGTWVNGSAVAINTTNYAVAWNDALEVRVTAAGSNGDAAALSVCLMFVLV